MPNPNLDNTPEPYRRRIQELQQFGAEEGVSINPQSLADFQNFINQQPSRRRAITELLHNGNLRAVWKDAHENHLGIEFLGNGNAEYVIFRQPPQQTKTLRTAGIDALENIDNLSNRMGLQHLTAQ